MALDILGSFPVTTRGNRYVLILMDYFTKWPEAILIPDQEASTVAEVLVRTWISHYGVPMILHSDQGTNFNSSLFTELCKLLGILKTRTTALHPESDGMVEKFNRTILNHLSLFVSKNQTDWDTHLPLFRLAYRSADHEVTGFTPADMFFGRTLRLPCDILFGRPSDTPSSPNEYLNNLEARLESVHVFARERIKLASERMKTRYDSGATGHHFKEGDQVWMYNPKRRRGLSPKLQQNWEGPYTIVRKLNDVIYRVQRSPNAKPKVMHHLAFQNYTAFHLVSKPSVDDLNSNLQDKKVSDLNFRPNIVVDGCKPFAEDSWNYIKFSSGSLLCNLLLFKRCLITTNDPDTGVLNVNEPLKTLRTYRIPTEPEVIRKTGALPCIGIGCGLCKTGDIAVGDDVFADVGPQPKMTGNKV
ncbi:Retrovirus-related Pol polyprotein from transposon 412 [Araneus ventricosus]|uniref:Retrovirus-related Pol polyprotein from transposon 412 n=1 Tax=Araneus ventricosus TaxID=182803 RepID=A0A4Y2DS00_ARAVE|nr:Retrovirus-related Pol polyprotein from transposon 412 [Araneus ventricosus]